MESRGRLPVFRIATTNSASILHVSGDLDFASRGGLLDFFVQAEDAPQSRVVVSLTHCPYCDSSALGVLLRARERLGKRFFVVLPATSRLWRLFQIAGVAESEFIVATLAQALDDP